MIALLSNDDGIDAALAVGDVRQRWLEHSARALPALLFSACGAAAQALRG